jgi:hypothetical protein
MREVAMTLAIVAFGALAVWGFWAWFDKVIWR